MSVRHLFDRHLTSGSLGVPETTLALIVVIGLALPFLPLPGEHLTRIAVRFQTANMPRPGSFIVHTSANTCHVLSALLSYQDPASGEFVQINCGKRADMLAQQIHAEREADAPDADAVPVIANP